MILFSVNIYIRDALSAIRVLFSTYIGTLYIRCTVHYIHISKSPSYPQPTPYHTLWLLSGNSLKFYFQKRVDAWRRQVKVHAVFTAHVCSVSVNLCFPGIYLMVYSTSLTSWIFPYDYNFHLAYKYNHLSVLYLN